MKNKKITRKISAGMYVLTTKNAGCMVDAVSQISSGDNPLISVAVLKTNNTNVELKKNTKFALSVLPIDINPEIIENFGFHSMKDYNKFEIDGLSEIEELKIINDSLGYLICEIVDTIDTKTHDLFIGRLIEADVLKEGEPMTYEYYQSHKDELIKVKTENGKTAWVCTVCGYVEYTEELPKDYKCPKCGVGKEYFKKKN